MEVGAILLLGEEQVLWTRDARQHARAAVLTDPGITMKQLLRKVRELAPADNGAAGG